MYLPLSLILESCDNRTGPKIVVRHEPKLVIMSIAIMIIFPCCFAIPLSCSVAPSFHKESVATRTNTA